MGRTENPYSPLGSPRTAHDAAISEEERDQFIKDAVNRASEVLGRRPINSEYAGRVFFDNWTDEVKAAYPDGVPFSWEGFLEFARHAKAVVFDEGFGPTRQRDFARAKEQSPASTVPMRSPFSTTASTNFSLAT